MAWSEGLDSMEVMARLSSEVKKLGALGREAYEAYSCMCFQTWTGIQSRLNSNK